MNDNTGPIITSGIAGAIIAGVGSYLLKIFLAWSGWKKERDRSTQDELYRMIDALHIESSKRDEEQAARDETFKREVELLRIENGQCREREYETGKRLSRLELYVEILETKVRGYDPTFVLKSEGSSVHPIIQKGKDGK